MEHMLAEEDMMVVDSTAAMTQDSAPSQAEFPGAPQDRGQPGALPTSPEASPASTSGTKRASAKTALRRMKGHQKKVSETKYHLRRPRRKQLWSRDRSASPPLSNTPSTQLMPSMSSMPSLEDNPHRYPDFCLTLSNRLVQSITTVFNSTAHAAANSDSNLVLSIGSGSGLLEAHLQSHWSSIPNCNLEVRGVEVQTTGVPVNRWLPEQYCSTVRGTWQLSSDLKSATALMFVYPREPSLISRYMLAAAEDQNSPLRTAVWLGPRADWSTFKDCLCNAPGFESIEFVEDCGLVQYEMMVVIRKSPPRLFTLASRSLAADGDSALAKEDALGQGPMKDVAS